MLYPTIFFLTTFVSTLAVVIDVTLPESGLDLGCGVDDVGYKPHPYDCRSFISCSKTGISWVLSCPRGLWYNPRRKICDYDHFRQCQDGNFNPRMAPKLSFPSPGPRLDSPPTLPRIEPTPPVIPEGPENNPDTLIDDAVVFITSIRSDLIGMVSDRLRQEASAAANIQEDTFAPFHSVQSILGSLGPAREFSIPAQFQLEGLSSIKRKFVLGKQDTEKVIEKLPGILDSSTVPFRPGMTIARGPITTCPFPKNSEDNNCNPKERYRTIDGSCNNLKRPLWGKSFVSLSRFLPPDYADGIGAPRVSRRGRSLPSARLVSLMLFDNKGSLSPTFSVMFMTIGQFLDHDIGRTAVVKLSRNVNGTGSMVNVPCGSSGCETAGPANRACFPINIPQNDPDFTGRRCLKFVRTQETVNSNCDTVSRQQLNQITSYLDSSNVYGSTEEELRSLRESSPTRGRLRTSQGISGQLPLLPTAANNNFMAGDSRVNEQVGLTAVHTVWHRYHNILEERLHHINRHWPGEKLFQESRKILSAVWQFIVYNEYLPLVVGPKVMKRYGLEVGTKDYVDVYDESINADAANAFQTAAFRFGHSQIPSILQFVTSSYGQKKGIHLTDAFNHPGHLYSVNPAESSIDSLVLGMISQSSEISDRHFSRQVTRSLFTDKPPHGPGTDLSSLNIQRGRDHGLPGYNIWRRWCSLPDAKSFEDLADIPSETRNRFAKIYRNVDDIDLYAGAMSERHVPGGAVGPTLACIIAQQFRNLKVGDRFWHERNDSISGFTESQLREIRKMTLAQVLCTGLDRVDSIQKFVLMQPKKAAFANLGSRRFTEAYSFQQLYRGEDNERRPCQYLDDLDLFKWWENNQRPIRTPVRKIIPQPIHHGPWRVNYVGRPMTHQVFPLLPAL